MESLIISNIKAEYNKTWQNGIVVGRKKKFRFGQASMLSGRFVWLPFPQYHVAFLFQIRSSYRQVPFLYVLLYTLKDKNSHFCAF